MRYLRLTRITKSEAKILRDFRKYDIWIDSMELVDAIYAFVEAFPNTEKYGLRSQITRSAVSIPSNIAEGASRNSENIQIDPDFNVSP